jgi:hypothetical protein
MDPYLDTRYQLVGSNVYPRARSLQVVLVCLCQWVSATERWHQTRIDRSVTIILIVFAIFELIFCPPYNPSAGVAVGNTRSNGFTSLIGTCGRRSPSLLLSILRPAFCAIRPARLPTSASSSSQTPTYLLPASLVTLCLPSHSIPPPALITNVHPPLRPHAYLDRIGSYHSISAQPATISSHDTTAITIRKVIGVGAGAA